MIPLKSEERLQFPNNSLVLGMMHVEKLKLLKNSYKSNKNLKNLVKTVEKPQRKSTKVEGLKLQNNSTLSLKNPMKNLVKSVRNPQKTK